MNQDDVITDARLLACGYTRYQPTAVTPDGITDLYQKVVRDAGGRICYFIDVQKWAGGVHPYTGEKIEPSYEFEAYFEDKKTGKPLRIQLYSGWDIDEAEKYIEIFFNLGLWKEYDTGE